jgi:hypothetical protein
MVGVSPRFNRKGNDMIIKLLIKFNQWLDNINDLMRIPTCLLIVMGPILLMQYISNKFNMPLFDLASVVWAILMLIIRLSYLGAKNNPG